MEKKFISFGFKSFDYSKFEKVKNANEIYNKPYNAKPCRGFWGCEFTPDEEYYSVWEEWLINNNYHGLSNPYSDPTLRTAITYQITDTAKICTVNSIEDYIELIKKYPLIISQSKPNSYVISGVYIDFEKLAEDFDAINFSDPSLTATSFDFTLEDLGIQVPENHQIKSRYSIDTYALSIPSICIFNPNIITDIQPFVNNHIRFDLETTTNLIHDFINKGYSDEQIIKELHDSLQDGIDLPNLLQSIREQIAQKQAREEAYKQNIKEYAPVFLKLMTLHEKYKTIPPELINAPETINLKENIDTLASSLKNIAQKLYIIKTGYHEYAKLTYSEFYKIYDCYKFIEKMIEDFNAILKQQLEEAKDARDTAKVENQQAQQIVSLPTKEE